MLTTTKNTLYGKGANIMKDKKFYIPAILFSLAGVVLGFFTFGAEAVLTGGIGLGMSIAKRKTHRVALSTVLSVIALIAGIAWIAWLIFIGSKGVGGVDYWLFNLLFGK